MAQDFQPTSLSSHSATKDLIEGIEDLVHAVLATSGNANELQTNNVSLIDGVRPHVNIVTDVGKKSLCFVLTICAILTM